MPAIQAQAKLMESHNRYDGIHPTIVRSVQTQARSLFRSKAVPRMNIEDLEQELILHVHCRLRDFDDTRASFPTFVDRIVRNHAATLIEVANAEKRGAKTETISLNEPIVIDTPNEPSEWSELIGDEHCLSRTPVLPRDEQIMLRHDLTRALQSLPASVREVLHWLSDSSISEAARGLGISRASLYDRLVQARTQRAVTCLEIYLGRPDSFCCVPVSKGQNRPGPRVNTTPSGEIARRSAPWTASSPAAIPPTIGEERDEQSRSASA